MVVVADSPVANGPGIVSIAVVPISIQSGLAAGSNIKPAGMKSLTLIF